MGRNDGASQNEDDLMDYAADLGCFSSSQESLELTFKPKSTGKTGDNSLTLSNLKSKRTFKKSNGLTFSDCEVEVNSL